MAFQTFASKNWKLRMFNAQWQRREDLAGNPQKRWEQYAVLEKEIEASYITTSDFTNFMYTTSHTGLSVSFRDEDEADKVADTNLSSVWLTDEINCILTEGMVRITLSLRQRSIWIDDTDVTDITITTTTTAGA